MYVGFHAKFLLTVLLEQLAKQDRSGAVLEVCATNSSESAKCKFGKPAYKPDA